MVPFECSADCLQLADTVKLYDGPWNVALVKNITEKEVTFFRPYGHADDFSYIGGVICYIGLEEFSIPRNANIYEVLNRKELK